MCCERVLSLSFSLSLSLPLSLSLSLPLSLSLYLPLSLSLSLCEYPIIARQQEHNRSVLFTAGTRVLAGTSARINCEFNRARARSGRKKTGEGREKRTSEIVSRHVYTPDSLVANILRFFFLGYSTVSCLLAVLIKCV